MRSAVLAASLLLATTPAWAAPDLRIGSKRFTESYVIAELARVSAERAGERVTHTEGMGGTAIVFRALEAGDIDLYPDYSGTLAEAILHLEGPADLARLRAELTGRGIGVSPSLGFSNTYALAVARPVASRLGLRSISDLAAHPEIRLALSHEFLGRSDGWPGLASRYQLPQQPSGIDHALAYEALVKGQRDAMDVYSTDAKIKRFDLVVLEDDRRFFPPYEAVLVYRLDARREHPRAFAAIDALSGTLSEARMIDAGARVEIDGVSFRAAAEELLDAGKGTPSHAPHEKRTFLHGLLEVIRTEGPRHLALVFVSLAAAILAGVPLGILAARRRRLRGAVVAVTSIVQTVPSLALLCFFIPILGTGALPAIAALFLYGLLPIVRNTLAGLEGIAPSLRESAEALGLSPSARLFRIELPLASRSILAGIKTSAVIGVGTATLAAFIGAGGFGAPISTGLNLNDSSRILEGAIPAALLALLVEGAFDLLDRLLIPRGLRV